MKTLLWIDDDDKIIDAAAPVFQENGFVIIKATNTTRALAILRDHELDGMLLDVRLRGGESGMELLEEIRRLYPTLRVAIFTGYPEYDDQVRAGELGALAYLWKIRKSFPLQPDKQRRFFQSLHKIFPGRVPPDTSAMRSKEQAISPSTLWGGGLFFILLFAVIVAGVGILSSTVSLWVLPVALVASVLLYAIVGAFVLRAQGDTGLSQKNFLSLTVETLRFVPLLRKQGKGDSGKTDVAEKDR